MNIFSTLNKSIALALCGVALLNASTAVQAATYKKLTSAKFLTYSHMVAGEGNITTASDLNKKLTTNLKHSSNQDLYVTFAFGFRKAGDRGLVNIDSTSHPTSLISCSVHTQNYAIDSKNKTGTCKAKKEALAVLNSQANIKLRFTSPGGGTKYLDWVINPPATQNGVKEIVGPGSVYKGRSGSADIVLHYPAAGTQTLLWGLYPKVCFSFGSGVKLVPDNANLITTQIFYSGEIKRSVDFTVNSSCKTSSGKIKVWYADPGQKADKNKNPSIEKSFSIPSPRR